MTNIVTYNGGSPITTLQYGVVFLGSSTDYSGNDVEQILSSLNQSLGNSSVLSVVPQYINMSQNSTVTAQPISLNGTSGTYLGATSTSWTRKQLKDAAKTISISFNSYLTTSPVISSANATTPVLILILPPGATLTDEPLLTGHTSLGVHGRFNSISDGKTTGNVYFCASAWISIGTANFPPTWEGWQNTCANMFKEVAQCWTNPDVDDLPDPEKAIPDPKTIHVKGTAGCIEQTSGQSTGKFVWAEIGNLDFINGGAAPPRTAGIRYG